MKFIITNLVEHCPSKKNYYYLGTAAPYQCCRKSNSIGMGKEISNPACFPIVIPADDPFYHQYNLTCLNYVRSSTTVPASCRIDNAEFVKRSFFIQLQQK